MRDPVPPDLLLKSSQSTQVFEYEPEQQIESSRTVKFE